MKAKIELTQEDVERAINCYLELFMEGMQVTNLKFMRNLEDDDISVIVSMTNEPEFIL